MFNFLRKRKAEKKVLKRIKESGKELDTTVDGLLALYILAAKCIKENKETLKVETQISREKETNGYNK